MTSPFGDEVICCRQESKLPAPLFDGWFHSIPPRQRRMPQAVRAKAKPTTPHAIKDFGPELQRCVDAFDARQRLRAAESLGLSHEVFDAFPIGFNATLDAISSARRGHGLAGSTVQWPLVEGAGNGAASVGGAAKNFKGMAAISLDEYATCLGGALSPLGLTRLHVCPLPSAAQSLTDALPDPSLQYFAEVAVAKQRLPAGSGPSLDPAAPLAAMLAPLPPPERLNKVEEMVLGIVRDLTG